MHGEDKLPQLANPQTNGTIHNKREMKWNEMNTTSFEMKWAPAGVDRGSVQTGKGYPRQGPISVFQEFEESGDWSRAKMKWNVSSHDGQWADADQVSVQKITQVSINYFQLPRQ